nr:replication initiation protein [Lachnospiraceae bacterium]
MTICKSQPFLALPQTKMTLLELKLFDIYLGKINPKDSTVTKVVFTKAELCKVLGVDRINNEDLKKCLKTLMSSIVEVKGLTKNGRSRTSLISLLSVADITYEDAHYGNVATIELECSERAKQYIYNVDAVGYLRLNLARVRRSSLQHR